MTAPSLRDRIARALHDKGAYCGNCGFEDGFDACIDCQQALYSYARAIEQVLADADPTDLGLEQVGWLCLLTDDPSWVPLPAMGQPSEFHTDLPVYARPRTEEIPDA